MKGNVNEIHQRWFSKGDTRELECYKIRHNSKKAGRGKHSMLKELVYAEAYKQECTSNM